MSIIHDALKKVQEGKAMDKNEPLFAAPVKDISQINDQPPVEQITVGAPQKTTNWFSAAASVVLVACALWFLYRQVNTYLPQVITWADGTRYTLTHHASTPSAKNFTPLATINVGSKSLISMHRPLTLNVQGVMANATGNVVLINDQVYQEGDEVDGIKIIKIELNHISVIKNGKQIDIPVKQ
jgi:hypothetical protein